MHHPPLTILAVETSCDETSLAIVRAWGDLGMPRFEVLRHIITSQIDLHRPFGGVVPSLAKREHIATLPLAWDQLFSDTSTPHLTPEDIDLIAVTVGPGLEPALWAGITFAQQHATTLGVPLIGVSHMEGHLYSFLLDSVDAQTRTLAFPMISLLVSGGHTLLVLSENLSKKTVIGQTRDDAVGEAYDKVARMLELPYPGGPEIERLAHAGSTDAIVFPRPMLSAKNFDFSFSGLKTSVLYHIRDYIREHNTLDAPHRGDIAASFQEAAISVLVGKTKKALETFAGQSLSVAGGVAANTYLRSRLRDIADDIDIPFFVPSGIFNTDNAAMIAAAGYINFLQKKSHPLRADGNLLF